MRLKLIESSKEKTMNNSEDLVIRALRDGHLQLITSGKTEKIRYVAANHSEKWSDPEEKVRAAYFLSLIHI